MTKLLFSLGLPAVLLAAMTLAGCVGAPQPANPQVTADIVRACTIDGVFKSVGGRVVLGMVPYAGMADGIAAAGIDKVCENPEAFSADLSTAAWVAKNLAALASQKH